MPAPITDLPAERAVLVACLADHSLVSKALALVNPSDLYDPVHRHVLQAMIDLDGTNWDPTEIARSVRRQSGQDAATRAIRLLMELSTEPSSGSLERHAKAVLDAAQNRLLVATLRQALIKAEDRNQAEALELLASLEKLERTPSKLRTLQSLMLSAYETAKIPRAKAVMTSGNAQVDDMTGGLRPGFTWVIAGGTSAGKSSMAIAVVAENVKRGARCLIVSLEDGEEIYGNRFLARESRVESKSLRDHAIEPTDHKRLLRTIKEASSNYVFLHCQDMSWEQVSILIDQTILRENIELVVFDYAQEAWSEKRFNSRQLELQAIVRRFRAICRKRKCCGIVCSQLTGHEDDKVPTKEMVRECKDIANGAEVVLLLYRDKDRYMANIDKAKDGTTGLVEMSWDPITASYCRPIDEATSWADDRFDGYSEIMEDVADVLL